jgi:hypothetical protein
VKLIVDFEADPPAIIEVTRKEQVSLINGAGKFAEDAYRLVRIANSVTQHPDFPRKTEIPAFILGFPARVTDK